MQPNMRLNKIAVAVLGAALLPTLALAQTPKRYLGQLSERLRPHYKSFEMKPLFIMTSDLS
jgi:hypothetical protein